MNPPNSSFFRTLIAVALACIAILQIYPFFTGELDSDALSLLVYHGSLALFPGLAELVHYPLLALWLVTYVGLFFFQRWARGLFLGLYIAGFLESLVSGIDVYMPWDSALITLSVLADGAIFALAFTQPIAARFLPKPAIRDQAA